MPPPRVIRTASEDIWGGGLGYKAHLYVRTCSSDRQAITMATITMVTYLPTYLPTLVAVALLPAEVRQLTVHLGQECHSRLGSHPQSPEREGGGRGGTES